MKKHIEPAGHRVLIKVVKVEEKTKSGIILTAASKDQLDMSSEIGEVMAIGPTAFDVYGGRDAWGIQVGQKVLFVRQGGKVVPKFDLSENSDEIFRIVNDEDIVGIVREMN